LGPALSVPRRVGIHVSKPYLIFKPHLSMVVTGRSARQPTRGRRAPVQMETQDADT